MPTPARKKPDVREVVRARAKAICEYCLSPDALCPTTYNIEHVRPVSVGGEDATDNMAWSCGGCNGRKGAATGAYDSETKEWTPLYNPRVDEWEAHFLWDENDDAVLVARTSIGRVTIERLQLNRPEVVNLRRVKRFFDEHHPTSP